MPFDSSIDTDRDDLLSIAAAQLCWSSHQARNSESKIAITVVGNHLQLDFNLIFNEIAFV